METKYTPFRRLSCAAGSPELDFSWEMLGVQPLLVTLFILTPN